MSRPNIQNPFPVDQTLETGLQLGGRGTGEEDALGRRQNRVEG